MESSDDVSLLLRALYDPQHEAVGLDFQPSPAFASGRDIRAVIEILAAITAKANCLAAEAIRRWDADEERKKALVDHYAAMKENLLAEMLEELDEGT